MTISKIKQTYQEAVDWDNDNYFRTGVIGNVLEMQIIIIYMQLSMTWRYWWRGDEEGLIKISTYPVGYLLMKNKRRNHVQSTECHKGKKRKLSGPLIYNLKRDIVNIYEKIRHTCQAHRAMLGLHWQCILLFVFRPFWQLVHQSCIMRLVKYNEW